MVRPARTLNPGYKKFVRIEVKRPFRAALQEERAFIVDGTSSGEARGMPEVNIQAGIGGSYLTSSCPCGKAAKPDFPVASAQSWTDRGFRPCESSVLRSPEAPWAGPAEAITAAMFTEFELTGVFVSSEDCRHGV